ncbi:MAG: PEP-CTERM sorting domain-containing protein [Rariglobus sp.]
MPRISLRLLPLLALSLTAAHAATILTENFNSYTPGVLPTGPAPGIWANPSPGIIDDNDSLFTRVVTDTTNRFGQGTSNQYLRLADTSNANSALNYNLAINDKPIGQVGTLSFNFYDPSGDGAQGNGWLLRIGTGAGNGATAFGLFLMNGQLRVATTNNVEPNSTAFATYALDTVHSLTVFFNSSSSAVSYGTNSLAANTMDVWLNGTIIATGLARSGGTVGDQTIDSFGFTRKVSGTAGSDFVGELLLDNIAAYSGVETSAIPEPSSIALLGGAGVMFAALLRRRR